ncbi:MAG TPA: WYL domain-containing protein [Muribaculum sp.]|jgi:predicted DNA-binding transcriptional regulator YafY|uniref:WYL domain-containing protein n=1 Tax=Heminiphilus faecis TaxID=2601703 RepID=A0ABV4CZY2_9BACT|nr:WYL domain-containing protein [Heminiphilus faecis]RLT77183.1 WYL domain-containing protein [bacterium J10(2018)]HRF69397.1 WYL domain-containing protein [Muribaculum sp.]
MPLNRATLIRISTIDRCLQNHHRRWTINDLIDACTDALAEYEGRICPISRRTFQNDLALMRSDRLGYNAPIVVRDNKYYEYEDPDYSITHLPLNDEGLDALNSALDILRQLQCFPQLASSIDTISKLNEQISRHTGSNPPAMDMEHVHDYRGAQFIGIIYDAVRKHQTIIIEYQSFKAQQPEALTVYPYLLKEYRNRWFLIAEKASNRTPKVNIFALDRIHCVKIDKEHPFRKCVAFDAEHFFDDTIGVTRQIGDKAKRVVVKIDRQQAPYVESKPFHKSQKVEQRLHDGSILLSLKVVINNELERLILGYGGHAEVMAPPEFRAKVAESISRASSNYGLRPEE